MTIIRLVVGTGSIAKRHLANLKATFPDDNVACVSSRGRRLELAEIPADIVYSSIEEAVAASPIWALVASPASMHVEHALAFLRRDIPVLLEKPLSTLQDHQRKELLKYRDNVDVAYHLRFSPVLKEVRKTLESGVIGEVLYASAEVGQYLADWRPNVPYQYQVSSQKALGGGALLELSHELDYITWLLGFPDKVSCSLGHSTVMDLEVEDQVNALFSYGNSLTCFVHMDMLQRVPARCCKFVGSEGTLTADLLADEVHLMIPDGNSVSLLTDLSVDRNKPYIDEIVHFDQFCKGLVPAVVGIEHANLLMSLLETLQLSSNSSRSIEVPRL